MGFETPQPPPSQYLDWTISGELQLPDFQREYKWEDERIRSLLVTVLRGHPGTRQSRSCGLKQL